MNGDQIGGVIRAMMALFSGWAISAGISSEQWISITGALVALVTVAWSLYSNSNRQIIVSAADNPQVKKVIVSSPALAKDIPSPKVVSGGSV